MTPEALWQLDRLLLLHINRIGGPGWDLLVGWGTHLGDAGVLIALLWVGLRALDPLRFPKNLAVVSLVLACTGVVNESAKRVLARPRPLGDPVLALERSAPIRERLPGGIPLERLAIGNPELARVAPVLKVIGPRLERRGLPSGHTATAFAAATTLVYAGRRRRRWLWLAAAAFVGATRVACGVHFPSDVLVGALIGGLVPFVLLRATEIFHGLATRPLPAAPRTHPGPPRLLVVAGETSGDLYGARLLAELRRREPGTRATGVGGSGLAAAGLERTADAAELSIIGFTGVLAALPRLASLYRELVAQLRRERPDALVCIDLPDFNFMLALQARALGIPAFFLIGPQLWLWRRRRLPKLADRISHIVVAFPFELPLYAAHGVPAAFHGHPLLDHVAPRCADRAQARRRFGLDPERRICVLAPGSRRSEWRHNADPLFGAAARLLRAHPELGFALPLAPGAPEAWLRERAAAAGVAPVFTRGDNADLLRCADLGIVCAGTATLEAAIARLPIAVFYGTSRVNAAIARYLVRLERIALPNLILGGAAPVYPELPPHRLGADALAELARPLLEDPALAARLRQAGAEVEARLAGAGDVAAAVAGDLLAVALRRDAQPARGRPRAGEGPAG